MTGTQNHECLAGTLAAVDYLADLGRAFREDRSLDRRAALRTAFEHIRPYERSLMERLISGLNSLAEFKNLGNHRSPALGRTAANRLDYPLSAVRDDAGNRVRTTRPVRLARQLLRTSIDRGPRTRTGRHGTNRTRSLQHGGRGRPLTRGAWRSRLIHAFSQIFSAPLLPETKN